MNHRNTAFREVIRIIWTIGNGILIAYLFNPLKYNNFNRQVLDLNTNHRLRASPDSQ